LTSITLPAPRMTSEKTLADSLKARQSVRVFSSRTLSLQTISDLLWAAAGINRPDTRKRTAPSARNWQEIDVYAAMETGVFVYDAKANRLNPIVQGDLRKLTGSQDYVATAPLNLVYVADLTKMKESAPEDQTMYSAADTGFIAENVYLFCASEGLGTVVRGSVDRKKLAEALNLPDHKKIILAQTIGYPGEAK
jgi:SagB-type dehydrogenase family enzyme